jgi:hypothetical protein
MSGLFDISGANSNAAAQLSGGPFDADTIINFSGSQTATPSNSENPYQAPAASATAALGGSASGGAAESAAPPVNDATSTFSVPSLLFYAAIGLTVLGIGYFVLKKGKL